MKSKKVLASLLSVALVSSFVLAGCGSNGTAEKKTEPEGEKKTEETSGEKLASEQHFNALCVSEPKTLDQSRSSDAYSSEILTNIEESLTRLVCDENGKNSIEPGLAESWTKSDDGLKWTFKLRDAKWSDDKPVTAQDFEYGIKRTLAKETSGIYSFLLFPIKGGVEYNAGKGSAEEVGVKAVDDKTLEIELDKPCAYFLDLTYFKVFEPQRKDIVEEAGETYGTEADTMIFCGPFTLESWVHNSELQFKKNPKYYDADKIKLDTITMKIITDTNTEYQSLYNGDLDFCGVRDPEWINKLDGQGQYNNYKRYTGGTNYWMLNTIPEYNGEKNVFSNVKCRQAFALSLDREGACETLYKGVGSPAYGFIPPQCQIGGKEFRELVPEEPVKALQKANPDCKKLFIEGMKELGLGDDPSKVTVYYLTGNTTAENKKWCEYAQENTKKALGINMEVDYMEWAQFQKETDEGRYQMASQGWTGDYNDPNTYLDFWISTSTMTNNGWKNDRYDQLIEEESSIVDQDQRVKDFTEAEKIICADEAVCIPEAYRQTNMYVRKTVKGWMSPLFGVPDYRNIYIVEAE